MNLSDKNVFETLRKGLGFNPFYTDGKKLQPSFIMMGEKGSGKTFTTINTFPGTMLILSFDNQTEIILQEIIKQEKKKYGKSQTEQRVTVANFFPSEYGHIEGNGDERRLNVGYAIIKDIEKIFENMRTHNIMFDHIVIDGFPELKDRINEYMRKMGGLTYTEPILGEDLTAYGYRNRVFQLIVSSMFEFSDICPVFTTYPKVDLSKIFKGKAPVEPEMDKNLKWEFRNIISIHKVEVEGKNRNTFRYIAVFESMKGTDFGEQGQEVDVTGGKPAIPPEKFEAYRRSNPNNNIQMPEIRMGIKDNDPQVKAKDENKEDISLELENTQKDEFDSFLDGL